MLVDYPDAMTMREARARYFEVNGFGPNGGYEDAWVDFKLGPIPFPFPNTPARIRAVKLHDIHHVVTAYDTDIVGEFEISAWEVAAGCKRFVAAWVLNLSGMAGGLFASPRRTFAAWMRGRRSRTVYGERLDDLLEMKVGDVRRRFVDLDVPEPGIVDVVLFLLALGAGLAIGLLLLAIFIPLAPLGLVTTWMKKREAVAG